MKQNFKFDKKTGTMRPEVDASPHSQPAMNDVSQTKVDINTAKPVFQQEKQIKVENPIDRVVRNQVVQMKRIDRPTPIQLINENGLPEAYLDAATTGVMMFREREDYDICQIADEKTGTVLAYIGGYALQINFNMAELNTMERIDECMQGIVKLFKHKIMNQNLRTNPS